MKKLNGLLDCNHLFGNSGERRPNEKYEPFETAEYRRIKI